MISKILKKVLTGEYLAWFFGCPKKGVTGANPVEVIVGRIPLGKGNQLLPLEFA